METGYANVDWSGFSDTPLSPWFSPFLFNSLTQALPMLVSPHIDVAIYSEPGSVDFCKQPHHTMALHVCVQLWKT